MKFLQNSSCGACRMAKVKCVHDPDPPESAGATSARCARCNRLNLECVLETRRSKWDKARPAQPVGLPAELASNPVYSRLISDLDKLRPVVEYKLRPQMFVKQVAPRFAHLLHLSLVNDDAAAFACAASHIQKFGLKPSTFRGVLEGRAPPNPVRPEAASSSSSPDEAPFTFTDGVSAAHAHRAPPQLPPHLAEMFEEEAQAIAVVLQNGERSFHVNKHCCVDPERLRAAVGPHETAAVIGLTGSDGQRFFQQLSSNMLRLQEKATNDPRPSGHQAELPPILLRFPDRLDPSHPPAAEPKLLLHVLRGYIHAAADGETMCAVQRYLPLARSSARKRKAAPGGPAQARGGGDSSAWGGDGDEGELGAYAEGSASPQEDVWGESGYNLSTLLEEVGGDDALLRELIDATREA